MNSRILTFQRRYAPAMDEPFSAILEDIARDLQLGTLLTTIISRACDLLGADDGAVGLYIPHRHTVQIEAVHRLPVSELGLEFEPGEGLIGRVLATGQPVIAEQYGQLEQLSLPELRDNSVIGVPILGSGDQLLGVFGIGARPPRKFDADDLQTLRLFARHAAIAIRNAMHYEREKRRSERMRLIAHISRVITAGLDAAALVAKAAQLIHDHLGYPNVVIPLLHRDAGEYLLFQAHAGTYADAFDQPHKLPVSQGVTGAAVTTRSAQIVNDVREDPRYVPPLLPVNVRTELAVPIMLAEEVFGCINIEGLQPFDEDDVASIQIIADHLAVAIKNVSLSREARRAAVMRERQRLARDLHDAVSQALSSISLMSQSIVPAWHRDPAEGERRAHRIGELSRLAFAEMRALLRELRPDQAQESALGVVDAPGVADVKKMGLASALQRYALILAPETPTIRLDFSAYRPQPAAFEEPVYLICREALSNAVRHSGANRLEVAAAVIDEIVTLSIQDNGCGFDTSADAAAAANSAERGIGLRAMWERAAVLGGVCEVRSQPGQGTIVCIRVPLLKISP